VRRARSYAPNLQEECGGVPVSRIRPNEYFLRSQKYRKQMDLNCLIPAIQRVRTSDPQMGSREATYLRTYPAVLAIASCSGLDDTVRFLQLATVVYGWMPRVLRLDPNHLDDAVVALREARETTDANRNGLLIHNVSACLRSVVGASKLLHFANPKLFPIWDRKVQRFRLGADPSQYHMDQVRNYTGYASVIHEIRQASGFSGFHAAFNEALGERLTRLEIPPYHLTEVRSVESAAFELAGNEIDEA